MKIRIFALALITCCFILNLTAQVNEQNNNNSQKSFSEELNMTKEQEAEFKRIRSERRSQVSVLRDSIVSLKRGFHNAMKRPDSSKEQLFKMADDISLLNAQMLKANIEYNFKIRQLLTEEQYVKYSEMRKNHRFKSGRPGDYNKNAGFQNKKQYQKQ